MAPPHAVTPWPSPSAWLSAKVLFAMVSPAKKFPIAPPRTRRPSPLDTARLARNEQFVTDRAGRSPEGVGPKAVFMIAPPWHSPRLLTARLSANVLLLSVAGPSLSKAPPCAKNLPEARLP